MKLIINTSRLRYGGACQVAISLINECRKFPENEYHVLLGSGINKSLSRNLFNANFHFYDIFIKTNSLFSVTETQRALSKIEKQIKPDCIITTSGPSYWHTKAPQLIGYNLPVYIYPESPFFNLISFRKRIKWFLKKILHVYYFKRDASAYIVQTEDVKNRVCKLLKTDKVYTVSNTCSSYFYNITDYCSKLPERRNEEYRFLTLSSYYPHKNFEIIPSVIDELLKRGIKNVKFILTLPSDRFVKLFGDKYYPYIINIGKVNPVECPSLYKECDFMFLPTLLECFSASYVEAMIMERPILTSDLGFAHTVCKNAAIYFDPMNAMDIADKIELIINNSVLRKNLAEKGLDQLKSFNTAADRARQILEICSSLVIRNSN